MKCIGDKCSFYDEYMETASCMAQECRDLFNQTECEAEESTISQIRYYQRQLELILEMKMQNDQ